jgi:Zn finger protein HypA/HybF involved in hydrogenase expression
MSVFDNFTKKVTDTAKAAAKKSSELVEVTKLNMNIGAEEDKIRKIYTEIGKAVYDKYAKEEEVDEAFRGQYEKIVSIEKAIEEMKQKILEMKNTKLCPNCSAELERDIAFCPKCGAKQDVPESQPVDEAEK